MTTIMKMLFALMKMVFLICWKILKIICGPIKDSLVHIGKGIWEAIKERYKKHKEEKAAAAAAAKESQSAGEQPSSEVREESRLSNLKQFDPAGVGCDEPEKSKKGIG